MSGGGIRSEFCSLFLFCFLLAQLIQKQQEINKMKTEMQKTQMKNIFLTDEGKNNSAHAYLSTVICNFGQLERHLYFLIYYEVCSIPTSVYHKKVKYFKCFKVGSGFLFNCEINLKFIFGNSIT